MSDRSKHRLLARRSGTAGIVICFSWGIALLAHFGSASNPVSAYSMRFAHCLIVVLPIPAVAIGLWSIHGLNRKEDGQEMLHALFGVLAGALSIVAILFLLKYVISSHV